MEINNPQLNPEEIWKNEKLRRKLAYEDPMWFNLFYLKRHFSHPFAPFHWEMFHLIRNPQYGVTVVMAFRESGKSTILNMGQVLWSILGKPGKKFVIIISETQEQAKNHFANIKAELETNERLKKDFGPFIEHKDDVGKIAMELFYHGAKILSVPREEPLRGLKFGEHRPDLIILDDVEDSVSAHDRANRRRAMPWFESEIVPVGTTDARIVVLGNLLHKESFIMQLREAILTKSIKGIFRAYPLFDDNSSILWFDKFPDKADVDALLAKSSHEIFAREYLLRFISASRSKTSDSEEDEAKRRFRDELDTEVAEIYERFAPRLRMPGYQMPLVPQMEAYRITAPDEPSIPRRSPGDPDYDLYHEFEGEISKSVSRWLRKNNEYANRK